MGRGRHTSGRGSDGQWPDEHGESGWLDERGAQEWLNDGNDPDWTGDQDIPQPGRPGHQAEGEQHAYAPEPGQQGQPPEPAWPSAWDTVAPEQAWPSGPTGREDDLLDVVRPEKLRRRQRAGRSGSRGRRLVALSAVAVVAAIGSAIIGIELTSSRLDLTGTPDCPKGQVCAAVGTPSPGRTDTEDPGTAEPSDKDSGSPEPSKSAKPSARAGRTPGGRTPAPSARPTPERTRRATPAPTPSGSEKTTSEPTPTEEDTEIASPDAEPTGEQPTPLVSAGRVAVDFGVTGLTDNGYAGRLTITNRGSTLRGWSVRVPVGGSVTGADGAVWTQEGDVLVLSSSDVLGAGDQVVVAFAAEGDSTPPGGCQLTGGTCRVNADDTIPPDDQLEA